MFRRVSCPMTKCSAPRETTGSRSASLLPIDDFAPLRLWVRGWETYFAFPDSPVFSIRTVVAGYAISIFRFRLSASDLVNRSEISQTLGGV